MTEVVIVDYGIGNLKSVHRGFEEVGANVVLSSNPDTIVDAGHLVLPGVGAFEGGIKGLRKKALDTAIYGFVKKGNPLLGICLGMQLLLEESEEHGKHQGLGLIKGSVKAIPQHHEDQPIRKIPHIGWSELKHPPHQHNWSGTCLENTAPNEYFYFVHSFMAILKNQEELLAYSEYESLQVSAAIRRENVTGLQFHPEKSGEFGLKILRQFVHKL